LPWELLFFYRMAPKRAVRSTVASEAKRRKACQDLKLTDKLEQGDRDNQDILMIFQELLANPSKIGRTKRLVLSDTWNDDDDDDDCMPLSYTYCARIPKNYLRKDVLPCVAPHLTAEKLAVLYKKDRAIQHKLFYAGFLKLSSSKIPEKNKEEFMRWCVRRMSSELCGKFLLGLEIPKGCTVLDWPSMGLYKLLPEAPPASDAAGRGAHRYVLIKFMPTGTEALWAVFHVYVV